MYRIKPVFETPGVGSLIPSKHSECNHLYADGTSAIAYCSYYEMRSRDMYCKICGKEGAMEELKKKDII